MKCKIFIVSLCLVAILVNAQQAVVVYAKNGTQTPYLIESVLNMRFSGSNLVVNQYDGTSANHAIADIRKLTFSGEASSNIQEKSQKALTVFPNPVYNDITITGLSHNNATLYIYSIDGRLVLKKTNVQNNSSVDVSSLSRGIFILKIDNQPIKIQKL